MEEKIKIEIEVDKKDYYSLAFAYTALGEKYKRNPTLMFGDSLNNEEQITYQEAFKRIAQISNLIFDKISK